jgi:ATP-dependent Clp protease ATP-binding subunit ClpA
MFERFTTAARETVVGAQLEARQLHQDVVGTEHLLLAMLARPDTVTGAVLARHGLTHDSVAASVAAHVRREDLDAEALNALGIDLDAVRTSVEATFGPGALDRNGPRRDAHLPFSRRAKKVLELSLREALALKSRSIGDVHIALGLLREGEGLAMQVLTERGIAPADLRRDLTGALAA